MGEIIKIKSSRFCPFSKIYFKSNFYNWLFSAFMLFLLLPNFQYSQELLKTLQKSDLNQLKILPLGNSITFDYRSNDNRAIEDKFGYRLPLYNYLNEIGLNFDFIGSEKSGSNFLPIGYDDNAGFPGIRKGELANLLKTGWRVQSPDYNVQITPGPYLETYLPDLILLHIGTNDNNLAGGTDEEDIKEILDEVDRVENLYNKEIPVIVSRIIDRVPNQTYVNTLNNNVQELVRDRVNNPFNPAHPDLIFLSDMEDSANIIYTIDYMGSIGNGIEGDMSDALHPNDKGYSKMAKIWFKNIQEVFPNTLEVIEQPKNIYAFSGEDYKLEFKIKSEKIINYQWQKNGVNIPGANDSIYIIENALLSDDSTKYSCLIESGYYSLNSDTVTIFISDANSRIDRNILTLYNFIEGEGNTINNAVNEFIGLDLHINDTSAINWIPNGLEIKNNVHIESSESVQNIINEIITSNEISVEAWVRPENKTQTGPARILTISENNSNRNITLSQDADRFDLRLRTTETSNNGIPSVNSTENSVKESLTHLCFTRNSTGEGIFYLNGKIDSVVNLNGNFSNWNSSYKLGICNEILNERPWIGKYYLIGIYNRALDSAEIKHNFNIKFEGIDHIIEKPTNLTAEVFDSTYVLLKWEDHSITENGFIIERKSFNINTSYQIIDTVGTDITNYIDSFPKIDSLLVYRISTFNDNIMTEYSNEAEAKVILVGVNENLPIISKFKLYQNYPNPFNPETKIQFLIPIESKVKLIIYNSLGEIVKTLVNQTLKNGFYEYNFSGNDLSSGIYYYKLSAISIDQKQSFMKVSKAILLK